MSAEVALVVFISAVVLAVFIGTKTKVNIGVIGIVFAFLLGTIVMDKTVAQVVGYFPTSLMFTMMIVAFFYGFASSNGTIKSISDRLIYLFRGNVKLIPVVLYVSVFVVATLGAGAGAGPLIMSPIAFSLSSLLGFSPILAVLAVSLGCLAGGIQPWTSTGVMFKGIAETTLGEAAATSVSWAYGVILMVVPTLFFLVCYFVLSRKEKFNDAEISKPEPLTDVQKKTLALVLGVMVLVIVPMFINMFFPNPVTKWFAAKFDIKVLCAIGIFLCGAMKLGNMNDVIKNNIPWTTIIMVCGMSLMISLAVETGVAELMGSWLGNTLPKPLILPAVILMGGLLSFVTTGPAVIFPLFIPMFPALSEITGISVVALTCAIFAGTGATGMSPFSQGGASAITGCRDEKVRENIWKQQLLFAFLFLGFNLLAAFLGVYDLIAGIFA